MQFLLSWRWTVYAFVKIKKVLSCPALSCHVISCPVLFCSVLFGSVYHFIMTEVVLTGLWSSKKKTGLHVWRLTWNIVIDIAVRILTLYSCNVYKQKIYDRIVTLSFLLLNKMRTSYAVHVFFVLRWATHILTLSWHTYRFNLVYLCHEFEIKSQVRVRHI